MSKLTAVKLAMIALFGLNQGCAVQMGAAPAGQGAPAPLAGTPTPGGAPLGSPLTAPLPGTTVAQAPGSSSPLNPGPNDEKGNGSTAELEAWRGGKLPPEQFFRMLAPAVVASSRQTGVPAAVTLAQAALETGWGASTIGDAKNLFGIKGVGPAGSVVHNTGEVYNGVAVRENATFRKYNNYVESIMDHDRLLSQGARYQGAMAVRNDPEAFARAIHQAGYATDPSYSDKLIKIMRDYNLVALTAQSV
jgi:hypothetical protein